MNKALSEKIRRTEERVLAEPEKSYLYSSLLLSYLEDESLFTDSKRIYYIIEAIKRFPEKTLCHTPFVHICPERSPDSYTKVEILWSRLLAASPDNIKIAKGLANFYSYNNAHKSRKVLKEVLDRHPDSHELWFDLGRYTVDAKERLNCFLAAEQRGSERPNLIVWIADNAVEAQEYDIAHQYAQRLLLKIDEARGIYGDKLDWREHGKAFYAKAEEIMDKASAQELAKAIATNFYHKHWVNTVMGQLALLQNNDIDAALCYLAESGNVGHDCRLASYGPSMKLAKKVCEKGCWVETIEYLQQCQLFWHKPILADWIALLQQKQRPDW